MRNTAPRSRILSSPPGIYAFPMGMRSQRKTLSLNATVNCVMSRAMNPRFQSDCGIRRVWVTHGEPEIITDLGELETAHFLVFLDGSKCQHQTSAIFLTLLDISHVTLPSKIEFRKCLETEPQSLDCGTEPQSEDCEIETFMDWFTSRL